MKINVKDMGTIKLTHKLDIPCEPEDNIVPGTGFYICSNHDLNALTAFARKLVEIKEAVYYTEEVTGEKIYSVVLEPIERCFDLENEKGCLCIFTSCISSI